jgi:hypothetical protein
MQSRPRPFYTNPWILLGAALGVGALVLVVVFVAIPLYRRVEAASRVDASRSNLQVQSLAVLAYAVDWNDHFPPAESWVSLSSPYAEDSLENYRSPHLEEGYGYALFRPVATLPTTAFQEPGLMIVETQRPEKDAHGGLDLLPDPSYYYGSHLVAMTGGGVQKLTREEVDALASYTEDVARERREDSEINEPREE